MENEKDKERVTLLKALLAQPYASDIIAEFARHLRKKVHPSVFATAYLEFLRDEKNHDLRRASFGVFAFAVSRSWAEMRPYLIGKLNEDDRDLLETPEAEHFYTSWLKMVYESIKSYWKELLEQEGTS